MRPRVSVIIPTYNRASLLREAVESVLGQKHADLELVIVDDGSADDTRSVVGAFSDERIRYFYKDNGGLSSACNFALRRITGEHVAYLDSDDMWPSDYLETMLKNFDLRSDYGAAYTRVVELYPDDKQRELSSPERNRSGPITQHLFGLGPCLMPSATCSRRSVWAGVWWDEALKRSNDFDVLLRISARTQFLFVPETYVLKRWFPENLSSSKDPINFIEKARVLERFYDDFDGSKHVSRRAAFHRISHTYRKAGEICYSLGDKEAALMFFSKAVKYYALDVRLYVNLLRALLAKSDLSLGHQWEMPKPLSPEITVGPETL
jgi:glycosyltransferase involved in cell wall biosynthesis